MPVLLSLSQTLGLVGRLDDSAGSDSPRERFRRFLSDNVKEVGQLRDYIEECLRQTGDQYARALQDLVNDLGSFLGFDVAFGRYQGTAGEIGFDGLWLSANMGFHVVIEVKTTEVYAVKTSALVGYVDRLISEKRIPSWERALGLYVVGRPDPQVKQLENAIVAEKRTDHLRVISVESLLLLAEMMAEYGVEHDDILAVIQPSGPNIDSIVDMMQRLVVSTGQQPVELAIADVPTPVYAVAATAPSSSGADSACWLTPVKSFKEESAEECIRTLVGENRIYAFGDNTPGRAKIRIGDWICFYSNGKGVVAHARIASLPENRPHQAVMFSEKYPWVFKVEGSKLYLDNPVPLDPAKRGELDAFRGRDARKSWAWFVQGTKEISEHDFLCMTRR